MTPCIHHGFPRWVVRKILLGRKSIYDGGSCSIQAPKKMRIIINNLFHPPKSSFVSNHRSISSIFVNAWVSLLLAISTSSLIVDKRKKTKSTHDSTNLCGTQTSCRHTPNKNDRSYKRPKEHFYTSVNIRATSKEKKDILLQVKQDLLPIGCGVVSLMLQHWQK